MSEVERHQVEQIDDEEQFSQPKSTPDPEHNEAEDEKVVLITLLMLELSVD